MQRFSSLLPRGRRSIAFVCVGVLSATAVGLIPNGSQPAHAVEANKISWIGYLNHYRKSSGLPAVKHNRSWDTGTYNHSCYMTANGLTHHEQPGRPGFTIEGRKAGTTSNIAGAFKPTGSPTADMAAPIDLWMSAPLHAIGILRPGWRRTSLGLCYRPNMYYATLDVTRGVDKTSPRMVVFPGDGASVRMNAFTGEIPDPTEACPFRSAAWGLPLIAMFPKAVTNGKARLKGPRRNWGESELCVLDHNDVRDPFAREILEDANAVIVIAPGVLPNGNYKARVWDDASGQAVDWWFKVNAR